MSEEILKALAQLFAIITKQDGGVTDIEREYVVNSFTSKLDQKTVLEYIALYDEFSGYNKKSDVATDGEGGKVEKLTSVKDSVKTLAICKKINQTLTQKQKVIVLIELLELVSSDNNPSPQRMQIIDTVSTTFNISKQEYKEIELFTLSKDVIGLDFENLLLVIEASTNSSQLRKEITCESISGQIAFLKVPGVDLLFMKHNSGGDYTLNNKSLNANDVVLFSSGSILKSVKGASFFYSDINAQFISRQYQSDLTFNVTDLQFKFPSGKLGIRNVNIAEGAGHLIGIMGGSGAGKTTLLNVLAGLETPSGGSVTINGKDVHKEKERTQGYIGYISQDDLLIEELTVFENIFYAAKLCFKDLSDEEITLKCEKVLDNLGLYLFKDLKVGSPLNKSISGGQRKRLNIALELIREPEILFVDEPTSGLSSRDSENVIDLLKELSLKGKLIFVVIHQPSSDIYKMFDKMVILDSGGYQIYYGNPIEAVTYFKKASKQANYSKGQCDHCGNVNPEQIFNIIEEKVVDEYGNQKDKRKINAEEWGALFKQQFTVKPKENSRSAEDKNVNAPSRVKQWMVFCTRDIKSKLNNQQYILINLLEAPLLAFILAFVIKYNNTQGQKAYLFRFNDNIPAYILMSIVVAIFMGLSISAEEIIKDRKILKRESFLQLSRSSYLFSKLSVLFTFSAIQTLTFVLIGNFILEVKGLNLVYWMVLFSCSCMANILGLVISSSFNTAVTVYIMIPLLLIPQMILSGAMFSFDKINHIFRSNEKVPVIADMMVSRWAFEALAVEQFKANEYEVQLYPIEQLENIANFNLVYLIPELKERVNSFSSQLTPEEKNKIVMLVQNEMRKLSVVNKKINYKFLNEGDFINNKSSLLADLDLCEQQFNKLLINCATKKEKQLDKFIEEGKGDLKDLYFNESIADLVRNKNSKSRIATYEAALVPQIDQVFFNPEGVEGLFNYRSHLFSPTKRCFNLQTSTLAFNVFTIWLLSCILFIVLYCDLLKRLLDLFEHLALNLKHKK